MALERGIAVLAFAVGLTVVILALVGCGGDDEPVEVVACDSGDSLPAVGARLVDDGESLRLAYAGAEPCMFGVDRYRGTLYVELRTNTEFGEIDRRPPVPTGCATGALAAAVPPDTPVEIVYGNRHLVPEEEIRSLLSQNSGCVEVAQGEPAFIID
jgi:hypothetical protein